MRLQPQPVAGTARGDPAVRVTPRVFGVLLVSVTVAALLPSSAAAESSADPEATVHPVVASYASDYGVSTAEAQLRLNRMPELQDILVALRAAEAERLAGWGIDHHGSMTAWVWLVESDPPSSAAAAIAAAHDDVEIRTSAQVTFASLAAAQDAFGFGEGIGAVGNTGAGDGAGIDISAMITHTAVDLRANALEIGIDLSAAPPAPSGALDAGHGQAPIGPVGTVDDSGGSGSSTLGRVSQLIAPHLDVPFIAVGAQRLADETAFEGGHRMTNGSAVCTSGFSAYHPGSGRYGVLTAGHCNKTTWTTQGTTLSLHSRQHNRFLDAALYLIPSGQSHQVTNKIICVSNYATQSSCPIAGVESNRLDMIDMPVCHSGANSGVSCGTVNNVRYSPSPADGCDGNGGPCAAVYVRATGPGMQGCKGDSGGPVYSWNEAYGIHKGSNSQNDCSLQGVSIYFSAIGRVESILGVDVTTSGPINVP